MKNTALVRVAVAGPLLLLLLLATAGPARAGEEERLAFGLAPIGQAGSYFELSMQPGETRELTVEVANHGTVTGVARTYAADVYTIINGGMGVRLQGEVSSGETGWIAYAREDLSLDPKAAVQRTFSVTVPADVLPGEYTAAIVVQNAEPMGVGSGGVGINQIDRHALAVAITVPGERRPGMAIGGVHHNLAAGTSIISFDVENTGNVRLRPEGEFVLFDGSGAELLRQTVAMDTFYPRSATLVEIPFTAPLEPGDYRASLVLTHEGGVVSTSRALVSVAGATTQGAASGPIANQSREAEVRERLEQFVDDLRAEPAVPAAASAGVAVLLLLLILFRVIRHKRRPKTTARSAGKKLSSYGAATMAEWDIDQVAGKKSPQHGSRWRRSRETRWQQADNSRLLTSRLRGQRGSAPERPGDI